MKKVFFFLVATVLLAANVNAQEVHGVESKMVCTYDCNPNGSWESWYDYQAYKRPLFAYEFTNLNSISVSVEVELYCKVLVKNSYYDSDKQYDYRVIKTKSFILKSGESYIYKTDENGIDHYDNNNKYYVKYKAYKLL